MKQTYFLGANTRSGFFSLYSFFPPEPNVFLHILKSGPGTGKSSFLRRIGKAAEARGMDAHYVLCSGDPDSLDGVYVPALGQAWVDGTAPHVIEPGIFGADSDYVNLGAFFRIPFDEAELRELKRLNAAYRSRYDDAYQALEEYAASQPPAKNAPDHVPEAVIEALPCRAQKGSVSRRFLSAISCKGLLRLTEELDAYQIVSCSSASLDMAASALKEKGWALVLCPTPLDPERSEALLLPEARLAFTAFPDHDETNGSLQLALRSLAEAKALHDEMEALYRPHMHFSALDDYTSALIARLFQ